MLQQPVEQSGWISVSYPFSFLSSGEHIQPVMAAHQPLLRGIYEHCLGSPGVMGRTSRPGRCIREIVAVLAQLFAKSSDEQAQLSMKDTSSTLGASMHHREGGRRDMDKSRKKGH